ncbi:hypothetical protein [Thermospira aquatica]|uniref:Uncharacterized protein n=1 Tax=Thermospira aquatica TaxID=2828656 RepID=A0AAX3BH27_9SPIR|nr:hypothetical protein [Thermospira aquatica]URA11288.1 hypothetical protein KDW03_05690 [Thermospira aquatica]
MEAALLLFLIGVALGGVGGFFLGSGRTVEVSNSQYTEVVNTSIQNQAQVTILRDDTVQRVRFVITNLSSKRELENCLVSLDPFQIANCKLLAEKELFGTRYTLVYPEYTEGVVTNTIRVILTNTSSTNQMKIK